MERGQTAYNRSKKILIGVYNEQKRSSMENGGGNVWTVKLKINPQNERTRAF